MDHARLQADVTDVIAQVTFWTSLAFVPFTSYIWEWWTTVFGRAVISMDILLVLAYLSTILNLTFGLTQNPGSWYAWFTLMIVAVIPVRTVVLAAAIWRLQRSRDGPGPPGAAETPHPPGHSQAPVQE